MAIELTPALFVDSDPTPDYWVDVTLPSGSGYSIIGHNDVPEEPNAQEELHIEVRLASGSGGAQTHTVDIGTISIDPVDGYVIIHLLDATEADVGGGTVTTEDATESSRPIGLHKA